MECAVGLTVRGTLEMQLQLSVGVWELHGRAAMECAIDLTVRGALEMQLQLLECGSYMVVQLWNVP